MISNKKIYKLSKKIRLNKGEVSDEDLLYLQQYRTSFSQPLSATFHKIRRICDKVDRETIVAFRLKRIGTIINKLLRLENTFVTTMGDIAGIRCIFKTQKDVEKALEIIKSKFEYDKKIRNYVDNPKQIGYKGIHIYIKEPRSNKKIEIQLRTIKDHNWATLVEITDLLYGVRLKELGFESNERFAQFHALMSSDKQLNKTEAYFIYSLLNETNFISKLSNTFRKNNNEVKRRWSDQKKNHSFFLIEASRKDIPILKSFSSFRKAEEEYFKKYKENQDAEIVLTSIRKPDFKQISIAYANYILSYHNFIKDIKPILKEMAREALEERELIKFKNIFKTYEELQANIILHSLSDSSDIYFHGFKKNKVILEFNKKTSAKKKQDIINKLNLRLEQTQNEHKDFIRELQEKLPDNIFSRYFYNKFLKKYNKRLKKRLSKKEYQIE